MIRLLTADETLQRNDAAGLNNHASLRAEQYQGDEPEHTAHHQSIENASRGI